LHTWIDGRPRNLLPAAAHPSRTRLPPENPRNL
jgi:hypothetical protein